MDEDPRRRAVTRLRYGDPRARSGLDEGGCTGVQKWSGGDADPSARSRPRRDQPRGSREDDRNGVRMAGDGVSTDATDARMPAVSATGRVDGRTARRTVNAEIA